MSAAHVLLRDTPGVFVAEECHLEDGIVTAVGRWRWQSGPTHEPRHRWGEQEKRSWPRHRLEEVRWLSDGGAS